MTKSPPSQAEKKKRKTHYDYVDLETAYLIAYAAWLDLDDNLKQLYPCPKYPDILRPRFIIKKQKNHD